jgi:hypothetical protein
MRYCSSMPSSSVGGSSASACTSGSTSSANSCRVHSTREAYVIDTASAHKVWRSTPTAWTSGFTSRANSCIAPWTEYTSAAVRLADLQRLLDRQQSIEILNTTAAAAMAEGRGSCWVQQNHQATHLLQCSYIHRWWLCVNCIHEAAVSKVRLCKELLALCKQLLQVCSL